MPRLDQAPRTRRRRIIQSLAGFVCLIDLIVFGALVHAWMHGVEVSLPGRVAVVGVMALCLAGFVWADRTTPRAERADRVEQRAEGELDGLPPGAFRVGDRIAMRSQKLWTWVLLPAFGVIALLFGMLLVALTDAGGSDMLVGGCVVLAMGVVFFVVRYFLAGMVVWLDREGITRRRPRRTVPWRDLVGTYVHGQQLMLMARRDGRRPKNIAIPFGALEISLGHLLELIATQRNLALGLPGGTPLPQPTPRSR